MEPKNQLPKLNRITQVLAEKERSQRWLARKLGISPNAMNAICNQRAQPLERFFDIAEILGVSITEIINVDYKPTRDPQNPEEPGLMKLGNECQRTG